MSNKTQPHLLIVEDNQQTAEALRDAAVDAGYRCTLARGGAAGFRAFCDDPPDLVATDLNMAGGDGYVLIQRIRQRGRVPVLVMTGFNTAYAKARLEREFAGSISMLTKPFMRSVFLDEVGRLLKGGAPRGVSPGSASEEVSG